MGILDYIKGVIQKLFPKQIIYQKIGVSAAVSEKMSEAIKLWSDCYENKAAWIDDNNSLHLPAAISKEMARLVTLELTSEITGSPRADYLNGIYAETIGKAPVFTEYACAKGGVMLKPCYSGDGLITDVVQADCFFLTAYSGNGEITGCVFVDRITKGKAFYTRLEYHNYVGVKSYSIANKAYMSENAEYIGREISLDSVPEWAEIEPEININGAKRPLFVYFKMPGANHIDSSSPLGCSVFANAVDAIRNADEQYSRLLWEFEGSELAVNVDCAALEHKDGKSYAPKHNRRLYVGLDMNSDDFYEVFSPNIREQSLINGLNEIVRSAELLSGLAYGSLTHVEETAKTATEIKISKQRSYATVAAIQKSLQKALTEYTESLDFCCTLYALAPAGKYDISFDFDDSLIVDAEQEQKLWLQEVASGLMSPVEYRMKRYGETEEQAKAMLPNAFGAESETYGTSKSSPDVSQSEVKETAEKVTGERLNGAQVKSLMDVITQYSLGAISEAVAQNIIISAFGISEAEAKKLLGLG